MRTVQLFCVLFSPCVHSRPSTVTYLIFVTVTKVITYSIDVYIYTAYYPKAMWKEGTLCAAHHCLGIVCFSDFFCLFLSLFLSFYVVFFDSCIGIQECKLDVKKQMWQVNVIYSNKFQEIVKALMFLFFRGVRDIKPVYAAERKWINWWRFKTMSTLNVECLHTLPDLLPLYLSTISSGWLRNTMVPQQGLVTALAEKGNSCIVRFPGVDSFMSSCKNPTRMKIGQVRKPPPGGLKWLFKQRYESREYKLAELIKGSGRYKTCSLKLGYIIQTLHDMLCTNRELWPSCAGYCKLLSTGVKVYLPKRT